jgi:hypothetical protein
MTEQKMAPKAFFAYPSSPQTIPETIATAIRELNNTALVEVKSWEHCRVGGNVIVQELCKEIARADLFCADATGLNANVMFELGYAIARNKRIWLILDTTLSASKADFDKIKILTTVGYASYCNSHQIVSRFMGEGPHLDLENTIFNNSIKPNLPVTANLSLLYLKSAHEIEAGIRVTKRLDRVPLHLITDDPKESGVQPLTWYGTQVCAAGAVVCHLTNPDRVGARLHNARYALVAGMALAFEKPLIILAEGDFLAPVDYRDILQAYRSANQATKFLDEWLDPLEREWREDKRAQDDYAKKVKLATELKTLQLGEYIAENEAAALVSEYFVETSAYQDALRCSHTIFVGRKGSGKTATLLKVADALKRQHGNLVCVIKPVAYELESLVELMRRYAVRDLKGFALESLWKFLLYTEIGNAAVRTIESRPDGVTSDGERELFSLLYDKSLGLQEDFSVRLERCVQALLDVQAHGHPTSNVEESRVGISEALHSGVLGRLRMVLGKALRSFTRVTILVDNLDKAWDRRTELPHLTDFLLALLGSTGRVHTDFQRSDSRRERVDVSLAVFLRSDIFYKVVESAREPDKIPYTRMLWNDSEVLFRVVEERFVASHAGKHEPMELWSRYFCPQVTGVNTRDYIFSRILHRPRDLMFFIKAAVATAVNRGHTKVQEDDVLEAEKQYSQYAVDSVLVEGEVTVPQLETIIYEFAGSRATLNEVEVYALMKQAGVQPEALDEALDHLCALSFLGVAVGDEDFRFATDPQEHRKNLVLARRFSRVRGGQLGFTVNMPFRSFLETSEEN